MKKWLQPIDNAPLILFRIFFGILLAAETFGSIATGWVKRMLIEPKVHFSYIGFEWLTPLPGYGMYVYYAVMGILGLLVMIGYKYRWSLGIFTLLWTGSYLMQKASYNNHYYLLILICIIMLFLPANKYASIDARNNPKIKELSMPQWCSWVMIAQMATLYFFATLAKFYPDWLDGTFTQLLFSRLHRFPLIGSIFTEHWFHIFIAYAGIFFDGLIIPALLWKRTRTIALFAAFFFHLFNSITLQIGIFPYFALSFVLFFYPPEQIRQVFFRNKPALNNNTLTTYVANKWVTSFFIIYFIIQLVLPIRHYFIKGDVLWTEEGHKMSWRMMLRERSGYTQFKVVDKATQTELAYEWTKDLTRKQINMINSKPDAIWQMAQHIKKEFQTQNKEVSVYASTMVAINNKSMKPFTDATVDLAQMPWDYFWHCNWILLYDSNGQLISN